MTEEAAVQGEAYEKEYERDLASLAKWTDAYAAVNVSSALMTLQNETGVPIGWGVLTPETQEQAYERAGLKLGNKGREAAMACLEMVSLVEQIRKG